MAGWREPWGTLSCEGNCLYWEGEGELVRIEPWGPSAIRFRGSKSLNISEENWTLLEPPEDAPEEAPEIHRQEDRLMMKNGAITVELLRNGTVNYFDSEGEALLQEFWIDKREERAPLRRAREYRHHSSESFKTSLWFKPHRGERFYGMGQLAYDSLDLKGTVVELVQKNGYCAIPFLLSSRGYGFIWNNPAVGQVELVKNHTRWSSEASRGIDYVIIGGKSPQAILEGYTALTGRPPMMPSFATGFWQCKLRYRSQEELLSVAREYHRRNLPLSMIIIDYFHWTRQGEWKFQEQFWPDPRGMVEELKEMGIEVMVSVWPTVDPDSENYTEMAESNMLIRSERGVGVFFMFEGPETYVDVTSPRARSYLWNKLEENYSRHGIHHFWLDEAEPEIRPYDYENVRYRIGNGLEVSNIYPFHYAQAIWEGQRSMGRKPGEIVNLIRCAWHGSQRFGAVLWSGDIDCTFDTFRRQITSGLNVGLCGISWWTTDIGGFMGGDREDPEFRELLVRWFQFGVFSPILRLHGFRLPWLDPLPGQKHGSGGDNEVWSFGEEVYRILQEQLQLREKLRPCIADLFEISHKRGLPIMRPLFFAYPDEDAAWEIEDQYLFGSDILVAPVTSYRARKRRIYFPGTAIHEGWRDFRTGIVYQAGGWAEVDAPLSYTPFFLREGSEVPQLIRPSL